MQKLENKRFYDFREFRLDTANHLLRRDGTAVALTVKEYELLLALVERAGEVVKKDELLDKIWADTFVEEGTLTRNVSWLRKKLEAADPSGEKFIETVPKRGYRFIPVVTVAEDTFVLAETKTPEPVSLTPAVPDAKPAESAPAPTEPAQKNYLPQPEKAERPPPRNLKWPAAALILLAVLALTGFGAYRIYLGRDASKAVFVARVTPFSGAIGLENTPAFSPDGKQLAFAWDGNNDGNPDIYLRLLSGGEPVRLTDTPTAEQYPTFSPDGTQIAFVRTLQTGGGEVLMIPALGGAERHVAQLFSGFASLSFSPDGKTLAVIDTPDSTAGQPYAVYLINLQTGERRRLNAPGDFAGETTPRFSPDGRSIAFVRVYEGKKQDIFVTQADGRGEARQITFDQIMIQSLAWGPKGGDIYYSADRGGYQPNIWRISAAGKGDPQLVVLGGGKEITNLSVAPDEKTIAFVANTKNLDIWRAVKNQTPDKKFAALIYHEHTPEFSPDGTRVAFVCNRTGKNEVWMVDADGKNLRQITETSRNLGAPRFSPDGSKIAFHDQGEKGSDIYVVPAEGGQIRRLTEGGIINSNPFWSQDGAFIYITSNRTGENQIWKMPAAGGEMTQITRTGVSQVVAAPASGIVYYTKSGDPAIRRLTPGGEEQTIPALASANYLNVLASTSRGLYFPAQNQGESLKIKFYDWQTNQITDAADNKFPNNILGNFTVSPNGNVFLYTRRDQSTSSIMLAEIQP